MRKQIKIVTYNIQHAMAAGEAKIAAVLRAAGADVAGLQEVDYCNDRSGGRDQPALLSEMAGMPYYRFTRAVDFRGGGYGTLILSKYPILAYETIPLPSGRFEPRAAGHAVLDIDGERVDFFNAHLSFENGALRAEQFAALAALTKPCRRFILTGDFNVDDLGEFAPLGAPLAINRAGRAIGSFVENGAPIDNILFSAGFAEVAAGRVDETYSDHYAVFATVTMEP